MDGCLVVERDLDKVISKFKEVQKQSLGAIDETIVKLLSAKAKLLEGNVCHFLTFYVLLHTILT
jgi:hypothetical protein